MDHLFKTFLNTPVGMLKLTGNEENLFSITLLTKPSSQIEKPETSALLQEASEQLEAYFQGRLLNFTIPLKMSGTPFQYHIWQQTQNIPFGQTASYKWLAEKSGRPRAYRAVGQAMHRNPIPIIVPCHRVISTAGNLTGYAYGLKMKQYLLDHERQYV